MKQRLLRKTKNTNKILFYEKGGEKNMKDNVRLLIAMLLTGVFYVLMATYADAFTAPTSGTFAYDIYDIGVNKVLKGPIGFVAGSAAIVLGAVSAVRAQIMGAIPAVLGGAALIKADAIVTSLGMLF